GPHTNPKRQRGCLAEAPVRGSRWRFGLELQDHARLYRKRPMRVRVPKPRARHARRGLTLLEVIISLAIFLFSLTAISHLLSISSQQVQEASFRSQAGQRCQSKLAEVIAGVQSMSSSGWSSFSDDPDWQWQVNCTEGNIKNLWTVQVGVRRKRA